MDRTVCRHNNRPNECQQCEDEIPTFLRGVDIERGRIAALEARVQALEAENARLREALQAVEEWDLNWADGLDSNFERIKSLVRAAREGELCELFTPADSFPTSALMMMRIRGSGVG